MQNSYKAIKTSRAIDVINDLYLEGDRDLIFLEHLIGLIEFDEKDIRRNILRSEVIHRVTILLEFLVDGGDFACLISKNNEGEINRAKLSDWRDIEKALISISSESNLILEYKYTFKKNVEGKMPSDIPDSVLRLF